MPGNVDTLLHFEIEIGIEIFILRSISTSPNLLPSESLKSGGGSNILASFSARYVSSSPRTV